MLVLTRKTGERLVLTFGNHRVTIGVLATSRGRAQIGIDAPQQICVLRAELENATRVKNMHRAGPSNRRADK